VKKNLMALASAVAVVGLLTACAADGSSNGTGGGGSNNAGGGNVDASACTNTIKKEGVPLVTVWAWYPNMELVVDNFNEANDDVQACWNNVGAGNDQYVKFQTAISAGSGSADVVMVEADRIPNYQIQGALVDISAYVDADTLASFSEGVWKDVSVGTGIYGAPIDGGPMGMIYRADVFETYGITPPTTWAEYEAAAEKVKAAGGPLFGSFAANVPANIMALQIQKGAQPFTYDPNVPEEIGISLNDQASKDVIEYWARMAEKGLVGTENQFTPEYIAGVVNGNYATYISAAWAPGYLTGQGVGSGESEGKFLTAPIPQWDPNNPVSVNWGGSALSVSSQASNVELAAKVALGLYADQASLDHGWQNQIIFPLSQKVLGNPDFINYEVPFFAGQQANKDVYVPAANAYAGFTYSPFAQFYYESLTQTLASIVAGEASVSDALDALQAKVVAYAQEQGFTVK
jgi:multiple sugar transport system substrate-binding protein